MWFSVVAIYRRTIVARIFRKEEQRTPGATGH